MRTAKLLRPRLFALACGLAVAVAVADDAHAADWHIQVQKTGAKTARLTFDAEIGQEFLVCWKLKSLSGDVCGYGGREMDVQVFSPELGNHGYVHGRQSVELTGLDKCGVDYKLRIRRTFLAFDTSVFRMPC